MSLNSILKQVGHTLKHNSPAILTAMGVSGTLSTAYLAAKASFSAARVIDGDNDRRLRQTQSRPLETKEKVELVWKLYIPAAASGVLTVTCIIFGNRIGAKRTAAAYSILSVSERAFTEYKEKVVEQIGEKKEQAIRDQIAEDRMKKEPVSQQVIIAGKGTVLCYEMYTGRYFNCDMETLRRAENEMNAKMLQEDQATLSEFYDFIGLPHTSYSDYTGWNSYKLMELRFSTILSDDNRPCIAFEYSYIKPF